MHSTKLTRKRATPEGPAAPQEDMPGAAEPDATAHQTQARSPLRDATNIMRPDSEALGSPPHPVRARTAEPGAAAELVPSPGRNRQLFLAQMTPQHMTCDLSSAVVGLGVKHNLQAILVACYPIQKGPPARRHVTLRDQFGATGC